MPKFLTTTTLLVSGLMLGFLTAQLFYPEPSAQQVPTVSDAFWLRIEWEDQGFRIVQGGVGTYKLRDNLRVISQNLPSQELVSSAASNLEMCFPSAVKFSHFNCIERSSCDNLIVTHGNSRFQVFVSQFCPVTENELPLGTSAGGTNN